MKVARPGQTFRHARAMIVIVDSEGLVHAWDVEDATANWTWTGVAGGRSTARITVEGPMHRRTRNLPDLTTQLPGGNQ